MECYYILCWFIYYYCYIILLHVISFSAKLLFCHPQTIFGDNLVSEVFDSLNDNCYNFLSSFVLLLCSLQLPNIVTIITLHRWLSTLVYTGVFHVILILRNGAFIKTIKFIILRAFET